MSTPITDHQSIQSFVRRHLGPRVKDQQTMLDYLGFDSLTELAHRIVPDDIERTTPLDIAPAISEVDALSRLKTLADKNQVYRSLIGMGYYDTHTPAVIARNIFENPGWYTSYTPYQPEISQGRLEALMNFQTMVSDLTGFDIANASMLDEATAAAEAMTFCQRASKSKATQFFVDKGVHPQTLDVVKTRAVPLGIDVVVGNAMTDLQPEAVFGVLLQYPDTTGEIRDYRELIASVQQHKGKVAMAADLLALTLLTPPGELGADIAVGNTQRFGVPLGFGGPHAAYMATSEKEKRNLPGRIVGVSIDSRGQPAYRLALQTREQHIRREKATSNICTAQALLAIMAGAYAVYHGPAKLKELATQIAHYTAQLKATLIKAGLTVVNSSAFDTLTLDFSEQTAQVDAIKARAEKQQINFAYRANHQISLSLDEVTTAQELATIVAIIAPEADLVSVEGSAVDDSAAGDEPATLPDSLPKKLWRTSTYLTHPVFNRYHSETSMMRYLRQLCDKDLALDRTMIPLGSCTMKLNAASELIPVSWPQFNRIHPFSPSSQYQGYIELFKDLEAMLCECTGYEAISLQPNSGAQGEYAGLLAINAYHQSRDESHRKVCLIPESAHGTNAASAAMVDMKVVVVKTDEQGNVDVNDLREKAEKYATELAATMVTYPSTHGVYEKAIREICDITHQYGGQVYLDGANLQAQVGLAAPGHYGADVSHLNLHKTFAIPHGGGGPGVGPIGVRKHLAPFLPNHVLTDLSHQGAAVSAAPWGSASILPISWMYITMLGGQGLTLASIVSMLNANYIAQRLREVGYQVLYADENNLVAHECIIDVRPFKESASVSVDDIAKRLMDFGFHAPTMSFPVPGTLMIEPTESESKAELDRFCDAMAQIYQEIQAVESGKYPADNNPLVNAPHTISDLVGDWNRPYSRAVAIYPVETLRYNKYFTPVNRVDNVYGDRHLVCTCPPMSAWQDDDI
ncbi:aminomethyl-transferring glycine dehydrogenase [Ostreibacterium oceani]|uniref:Glycine dehydrogenase (decarboxylating) n=1 Tax=Ostreibacterium oceani TaxID=2654998 RepID=A0A6N7F0K0_9GAMM|nr:aminomethyl-transferring glycine dehydrogenase [Ostreibacterium oceani]MPV86927.1 aminomethyl-transferring glycine dehydrogenase [Ostreibacterium oceani]